MAPFKYTIDTNGLYLEEIVVEKIEPTDDPNYMKIIGRLVKETTTNRLWGHVSRRTTEYDEPCERKVPTYALSRKHWDHCFC